MASATFCSTSCLTASIASATTAISPTVGARPSLAHSRRLLAVPEPAPTAPAADYRERYQQLTGRSIGPLSVMRRPHDRNRRHSPYGRVRRCGFLEHLMIPCDTPSQPSVLDQRQLLTPPLRLRFQRRATDRIQAISPRSAAISGGIDQSPPMAAPSIPIAAHRSVGSDRYRHSAPTTGRAQSP